MAQRLMFSSRASGCVSAIAAWEVQVRFGAVARFAPLALVAFLLAACSTLVTRPQPPVVSLESLRIEAVSAGEARIIVSLALENTNDRGVSIDALDFSIAIAEVPVASGALAAPLALAARGSARADIVARTDFSLLRSALDASLARRSIDYEITGNVTVEGRTLPFARRGQKTVAELLGGRR